MLVSKDWYASKFFVYVLFYEGYRVWNDLDCCLEGVLDLGDNSSKFSQTIMKDVTIDIINNIKSFQSSAP